MADVVELHGIRKTYDHFVAVERLSLSIRQGGVYGLLGPNGAGKTSTIRMMIGITMPDEGEVRLFGEPFHRRQLDRIGYLPEERGLYKKMKVLDHLVFLGRLHNLSEPEARKRSLAWCERLQMTDWTQKKVEELSKGMQQKIQFAATLLHEPDLIIMDEPFSGLDPANAVMLKDVLIELKKAGKTILFSTHRMDQVEKICDAIALISRGHLVLSGSMREVKSRYPRNRVQVSFEGDDSFLQHPSVETAKNYGGQADIKLNGLNGASPDAQPLLAAAIQRGTRISRFEVMEPTLEEIFIETVGENVDA